MLNLGFDFWWFHAQCLLVSFLVVTEKVENIGCKSTSIGQFLIFESFSSKTHQIWRFGGLGVSKRCPTWCAQQLGIFKGWTACLLDSGACEWMALSNKSMAPIFWGQGRLTKKMAEAHFGHVWGSNFKDGSKWKNEKWNLGKCKIMKRKIVIKPSKIKP